MWGNLVFGRGGGSAQRFSPIFDLTKHIYHDVIPWFLCCSANHPSCFQFYERRPSDDGWRFFRPPIWAWGFGDPHFITPDGKAITFNGVGEYILTQSLDEALTIQGNDRLAHFIVIPFLFLERTETNFMSNTIQIGR